MKKNSKISCILGLLFWGGCQSLPQNKNPSFESFQIQKVTSAGIETVSVTSSLSDWPQITNKPLRPNLLDAKKLRLAVIGDTGCRLKESKNNGSYQNCNISKEWPYPEITKSLSNETFDFGIHTGDFHYREQCSDPKLCPAYAAHVGYGWGAWWDDFFAPSLELFKKSAWIFVRGNHEDCSRAYQGWAILSPVTKKITDACEKTELYQWIEMQDLVFINFDNSAFEDRSPLKPEQLNEWSENLAKISDRIKKLNGKKEIWFLMHKPIAGFVPDSRDAEPVSLDDNGLQVMKASKVLDQVDVFLSGHIHNQQIVPTNKNSFQLIVGHSGSSLDPFGRKLNLEKLTSITENKYSFGYALFQRQGFKNWDLVFKDTHGEKLMQCHLEKNKLNCD